MNREEEFESAVTGLTYDNRAINNLIGQALLEGADFEREAERCRMESERAFKDVGDMKKEGQRRAAVQQPRMLPSHQRAVDVRTNTMKAMADAKGDHVYFTAQANMYAAMASMKFAKAAALIAKRDGKK